MKFNLPDVGEGLAEVEIVEWLVDVGQDVREDEPLVEVETDKAVVQITTPVTGRLVRQAAAPGEQVAVGAVLAEFVTDTQQSPSSTPAGPASPSGEAPADAGSGQLREAGSPVSNGDSATAVTGSANPAESSHRAAASPTRRPRATPATRGLARRLGVDLGTVTGSGPGDRIMDADVNAVHDGSATLNPPSGATTTNDEAASDAAGSQDVQVSPSPHVAGTTEALRGVRRVIAETMTQSWQTIPHVSSFHEVDMGALASLRGELKLADRLVPLTAFLVVAAARALRSYPELNASVGDGAITHHANIDLGIAFDGDSGVIVPVVRSADTKSVWQVAAELRTLGQQVEQRSLAPDQLRAATFTVNNYGPLGGWFGTSLVTPPQVGILSLGPVRDQVVPVAGEPGIRPIAVMNLAADHRVADGRGLIGFCTAVREQLEHPIRLVMEA